MMSTSTTALSPGTIPMTASLGCLVCHQRAARLRGNCLRCWNRHNAAVRRGETTWEQLEQQGLAQPPQQRGQAWRKDFPFGRFSR